MSVHCERCGLLRLSESVDKPCPVTGGFHVWPLVNQGSIVCWFRYVESLDVAESEAMSGPHSWRDSLSARRGLRPSDLLQTRHGMLTVDVVDGRAVLNLGTAACRLDRWMLTGPGRVVEVFAGSERVLAGPSLGLLGRYWEGDLKAIDRGEIYSFIVQIL